MENHSTQSSNVQAAPQTSTNSFAGAMSKENKSMSASKKLVPAIVVVVFLGLGTGLVGAKLTAPKTAAPATTTDTTASNDTGAAVETVKVGQVFGAKDASSFKDSVEGVLIVGGVGGEGSHHIVRPGGASQNVYLTSSVVDLKLFEGARVKVSGETFKAQKAGWLMDVGRVEVKELNAPLPDGTTPAPASAGQDE
ncbi:MAG: hypothetical protein ABI758_03680 [Candidatus Woesebacteria bacterium]